MQVVLISASPIGLPGELLEGVLRRDSVDESLLGEINR